jgi:ribosome-associated heat shock protein Hsp15
VTINGNIVKPAREIQVGETIVVRKPPVNYTFKVKGFPKSRVGAKLVMDYLENLTPADELQKLDPAFMAFNIYRERGTGRPTKKDRRSLDELFEDGFEVSTGTMMILQKKINLFLYTLLISAIYIL